jgi:hypothetical protein
VYKLCPSPAAGNFWSHQALLATFLALAQPSGFPLQPKSVCV